MKKSFIIDQKRRQELMYQFYYKRYGQLIRKKRKEKKLTQEELASGICSNTYISKAENNQVAIGEEQLYMIMEKLKVTTDEFLAPEELIKYLTKSIKFFYLKDRESYQKIFEKIEKFEFQILAQVIKLGYLVLTEKYQKAKSIYEELFQYLSSLDDYGFTVFMVFSSFYNIGINKYSEAKYMIDSVKIKSLNNDYLEDLLAYLKYIVYGNLHQFVKASTYYDISLKKFTKSYNIKRVNELLIWQNIFLLYSGDDKKIHGLVSILDSLSTQDKNRYLLLKAYNSKDPTYYIDNLEKSYSEDYLFGLYIMAKYYLNKNKDQYLKLKEEITKLHYQVKPKIDFSNLLRLKEKENLMFLKDYLVNYCLKVACDNENIFLVKKITEEIVEILQTRNRYKDALTYELKAKNFVKKLNTCD